MAEFDASVSLSPRDSQLTEVVTAKHAVMAFGDICDGTIDPRSHDRESIAGL
jgi:hypothetical protein